jgi:hypothetical protein
VSIWRRFWLWLRALLVQLSGRARLPPPAGDGEDRALSSRAARCIACGACDRVFRAWADVPRDRFFGPMHFALRAGGGPEGWVVLGEECTAMGRADLLALERVCPVDVPFGALVRAVRAKAPARVSTSRVERHDPG